MKKLVEYYLYFVLTLWAIILVHMPFEKGRKRLCIESYGDFFTSLIVAVVPLLNVVIAFCIAFYRDKIYD